jgi:hypothetical protein
MKLLKKQNQTVFFLRDNFTREIIYGGAAGGGKSALGCLWLIEQCTKYPGTRWVMGRSKLKTLKETTLNTFFELSSKLGISHLFELKTQAGIIKWTNGSEIILKDLFAYPSDPEFDSLGSLEITGAFVDEVSQVTEKAWQILSSRIRYKLNEYDLTPKLLGTCNPSKGWVYRKFYKPFQEGNENKGKKFIQSLPTDNPHLPESYLEALLALDKNSKERLYYGNWEFDDDPAALCDYNSILDCFTNDHVQGGQNYISADLAMKGRDRFVAGHWEGNVAYIDIVKEKSSGKEIEADLRELMKDYKVPRSRCVADSDGLGNYLESYLNGIVEFKGNGRARSKMYKNIKAECAYKLAELINKAEIKIICEEKYKDMIVEELEVLKADDISKDETKKSIISKDHMKDLLGRSPDFLDFLLMKMIFNLKNKTASGFGVQPG